ncbi:MAG: DUF4373 domain-containing protein [Sedimentibacter saalensis]|jgi:hypothetical protein|uniref:Lin1244/Lin1753 domain-containing protein n=1 Tax=Sedimentibacter saalensis TaxID=130788 RepID=UPI002B1F3B7C|nr:Lin1244/Lin1753 domain-containing protein [Sedimentibacter saalensis]MEA5096229.1 DUF4373 domain-containing protein [Sedimentibacter saalensis]
MGRPKKEVVEYFPHFVSSGKTLFILEQTYGNDGYAFWFKVLELLGHTDGHYYDCNNTPSWRFLLAKTNVDEKKAVGILDMLVELDAIDKELWNKRVIWSENFVKNLAPVYSNRKSKLPKRPIIGSENYSTDEFLPVETQQNTIINEFLPEKLRKNVVSTVENSQSKVKKVKNQDVLLQVKKLRQRYSKEDLSIIDTYLDTLRWTRKNGKIADSVILSIYQEWEKFSISKVIYALKVYINNPKYHDKRENYCYGIMRNATSDTQEQQPKYNFI